MSNESLSAWKVDTSLQLVHELPYQTLESALVLVDDYVSATGGWIPDDPADPTGPGQPASGETQTEAAATITLEQMERMYTTNVNATINIDLTYVSKLVAGLSEEDVLVNIEEALGNWIEAQIEPTDTKFITMNSFTGSVTDGGLTTTDERTAIQTAVDYSIDNDTTLYNPKEIAVKVARETYNLDNTFNLTYIFTEVNNDLIFLVEKYLADNSDLDLSDDSTYTISLDPATYVLTSGISKKREPVGV